jgi:hypothetical protein
MITLSISQALLLLIEKHSESSHTSARLKKLYLMGVTGAASKAKIQVYLSDPILRDYKISSDPSDINEDPETLFRNTPKLQHSVGND